MVAVQHREGGSLIKRLSKGDKVDTVNKHGKRSSRDKGDDLSPKFLRELRRRIADANDPVRYVVFSDIMGNGRWRLWLDVSADVYGMSIDQATLFKRRNAAQAVAKTYSSGRKNRLSVAKVTTRNGKRKILKAEVRSK